MNRILIGCGMVLTIALTAVLVGFGSNNGVRTDAEISAMISRIEPSQIQNTVNTLANTFTHQSCSDSPAPGQGVTAAREFIFSKYSAIPGLQVVRDPFVHPSCPTAPTFNVIAWKLGEKHPERLVIVGGHYDSRTIDVFDSTSFALPATTQARKPAWFWKSPASLAKADLTTPSFSCPSPARNRDFSALPPSPQT